MSDCTDEYSLFIRKHRGYVKSFIDLQSVFLRVKGQVDNSFYTLRIIIAIDRRFRRGSYQHVRSKYHWRNNNVCNNVRIARETKSSSLFAHNITISRSRSEKSRTAKSRSYKRIRSRKSLAKTRKKTNVKFSYVIEFEAAFLRITSHRFNLVCSKRNGWNSRGKGKGGKKKEKKQNGTERNAMIKFSRWLFAKNLLPYANY